MYSVTDQRSLSRVDYFHTFISHIRRHCDTIPLVIVGNKVDQSFARQVSISEPDSLAKKYDCSCREISIAESKEGVLESMDELLKIIKREMSKNIDGFSKKSTFNNVKRVFKKKVTRSRSDSFFR